VTIDVLLPTYNRTHSFLATLAGVALQEHTDMHVIVADQGNEAVGDDQTAITLGNVIEARGGRVTWHRRPQVHGIAEQRDFLLGQATARWVLYLDDDVIMEPWVAGTLLEVVDEQGCGFAGAFPAGLSHRDDVRPEQQVLEFFAHDRVVPETVTPGSAAWDRWNLHRAANLWHAARGDDVAGGRAVRPYRVAWVASCVLYDREKLEQVGGFGFWRRLPRYHSGEEVLVQNLLMRLWGGCGIIPSGTYYTQLPSTVLDDSGGVDGHALELLAEMVRRYAPGTPEPPPGHPV
jgi:GT2 family glycosyltransferase